MTNNELYAELRKRGGNCAVRLGLQPGLGEAIVNDLWNTIRVTREADFIAITVAAREYTDHLLERL